MKLSTLTSVEKAHDLIATRCKAVDAERVPLAKATGRVLRKSVRADRSIPPFNRSAMDGYAVRSADFVDGKAELAKAADIPAGTEWDGRLGKGQCASIMTGAPVPKGADAVVKVEQTKTCGDKVLLDEPKVEPWHNVHRRGADARKGQALIAPGRPISQGEIGVASQTIIKAIAHISTHSAVDQGQADPHNGLINVDPDGRRANGVAIEAATYHWSETYVYTIEEVGGDFESKLYTLANAPVNSTPWRGFNPGEVRFRGARGQVRSGTDKAEVTFSFACKPNVTIPFTIQSVSQTIEVDIEVKGWHYAWVESTQSWGEGDATLNTAVKRVHVEQVYEESDYSALLTLPADSPISSDPISWNPGGEL